MTNIVLVGLSHTNTPVEVRERLSFDKKELPHALSLLHGRNHVDECVILSTCNRIEVYSVTEDTEPCTETVVAFLSEFHGIPRADIDPYVYILHGEDAVIHLLRVACSLDSMVVGEPQILGQVKQAYRAAHDAGATSLILNRLFHYSFSVAKRVRHETNIGAQAISVSYAAVELAKRIFDDLSKRTTLLIGTGEMGELAARHLISSGIKEIVVAGRSESNTRALAAKLGGRPIKMEEVPYFLRYVDVVISATGSSDFIIRKHHLQEALKLRRNEPMFMIDIAVPRDIDPRVEEMENIYLYDIDDLRGVTEENIKERRRRAERAEEIVSHGGRRFMEWLDELKVVPVIISLKRRVEEIKEQELEKALRRLGGLEERQREVVANMASAIVGKILHAPLTNLKRAASTSLGAHYSDTLKELFDLGCKLELDEDDDQEAQL